MRSEEEVKKAIEQCESAQLNDDPKLCPMYDKDESLYCVDCTCRDAFNWFLENK